MWGVTARRRSVLALVAVVGVGALTGCASGSPSGPGHVASSSTSPAPEAPAPTAPASSAAELAARMRQAVTLAQSADTAMTSSSGPGIDVTGKVLFSGTDVGMDLTVTISDASMRVVRLREDVFVSPPEKQRVDGKPWLRVKVGGTDQLSVSFTPFLTSVASSADLLLLTNAYAKATGFTVIGAESEAGLAVTHYRLKLDGPAMLEALPPAGRSAAASVFKDASATVDVFVDSEGRPARIATSSAVSGQVSTTTTTFKKWGEPVTIEPPPAADVADPYHVGG